MTPQELRNSILQLAIQGKLVPQRPEDGSAADLLREIQEQRERENVAASPKRFRRAAMETPAPVSPEEIPFDIPETWKWVRLENIIILNPKNNNMPDDTEASFIPMSCVSDGYKNRHTFEIKKWGKIKKGFTHFANGDIGIAKITPCFQNRKSVIFKNLKNGIGSGTTELSVVRVVGQTLVPSFFLWFFKSKYFISNGIKSFTGTAGQQRIHKDYLAYCLFPLPPLIEQKRIVAKIEELMPLVDRYEKAWNARKALDKRFPEDLQKSLLQLAIQGKLVPQNPADGNAEDLFRQIQEQRNRETAAAPKRSRRAAMETPAPVSPDEIPFDIPETWKWVKFVDAIKIRTNLVDPKLYPESIHIAPDNIEKGSGKILEFHSVREDKVKSANHFFKKGQILYSKIRPLLRKATIAPFDGLCSADMYPLETPHDKRFVLAYLLSDGFNKQVASIMSSRVKMPKINQEELSQVLFPLPPPAEQQRIAAKLADILPLCEKLSSHAN